MDCQIIFLTVAAPTMVADVLFLALMEIEVFLQISLLSKAHATAFDVAHERLILGVAPQMSEVFAERWHYASAPFKVANENFGRSL